MAISTTSDPANSTFTTQSEDALFNNITSNLNTQPQPSIGIDNALFLGSDGLSLLNADKGNELVGIIIEGITKIFKETNKSNQNFKVIGLDKSTIQNIAYSSVVVALKHTDKIFYYTILLEKTGRSPLSASDYYREYLNVAKSKNPNVGIGNLYTTDDALDDIYHKEIQKVLIENYNISDTEIANLKFSSLDGIIIPYNLNDINSRIGILASLSYNTIYSYIQLSEGNTKDLTLAKRNNNDTLSLSTNFSKVRSVNELGLPVRSDWVFDLNLTTNTQANSINIAQRRSIITKTSGYVDYLPEQVNLLGDQLLPNNIQPYNGVTTGIRFRPNIIISGIQTLYPTLGYGLLGIIASLVIAKRETIINALVPKDSINQLGNLNLLANIERNVESNLGNKLNLLGKELRLEEVHKIIQKLVPLDPVISLDIECFGLNGTFMSPFMFASSYSGNQSSGRAILDTANQLTNGNLYNILQNQSINVTTDEGIIIPSGYFMDSSGERDLRDIDLAYVTGHTEDMNLINKFVLSNLPYSQTNSDSYITRMEVISKLVPDAVITGKICRVTLSSAFINALSQAASQAGLGIRYDQVVNNLNNFDITKITTNFMNNGINGNFGNVFNSGYNNLGTNNFQTILKRYGM